MKAIEMLTLVLGFSGGFALGAAAMYALILIAFKSDGAKKRIAEALENKLANR
jgi:hypothetical protein